MTKTAIDLDDIREAWSNKINEILDTPTGPGPLGPPELAEMYDDAYTALDYFDHAEDAAAYFQRHGAFLLARAAELAGR